MQLVNIICGLLSIANSLSWSNYKFRSSTLPSTDLKVIDSLQCNIISKLWYKKLMGEEFGDDYKSLIEADEDYDPIDEDDWMQEIKDTSKSLSKALKIKHNLENNPHIYNINKIESILQKNQQDLIYLSWMPEEEKLKTQKFVLALIICKREPDKLVLKHICCNPEYLWSENISLYELKNALFGLSFNKCDMSFEEFLESDDNKRIKLEWMMCT